MWASAWCHYGTRRDALPTTDVIEAVPDYPGFAFEARVLRTLSWFGLMERRVLSFDAPVRARPYPMF